MLFTFFLLIQRVSRRKVLLALGAFVHVASIPSSVSLFLHVRCYRNFNEAIYAATSTIVGRVNEKSFHGHLDIDLEVFKATTEQEEIYYFFTLLRKIQSY